MHLLVFCLFLLPFQTTASFSIHTRPPPFSSAPAVLFSLHSHPPQESQSPSVTPSILMRQAHTRSGKPIPLAFAAFPVAFYLILIGVGYYIYVVTLGVRLLRDDRVVLGVILLVIYHITFILMLWAYAMVILTDPGQVTAEHQPAPSLSNQQQQQPQPPLQSQPQNQSIDGSTEALQQPGTQQPALVHTIHDQKMQKDGSIGSSSVTVLIPGAQTSNRSGYIHVSEDPSVQGHPLWCSKCQHVKPERAHHCRVCRRCVLRMDHHCPWVLNCVGQDNYKFFCLFVFYTAIHCLYILISLASLYQKLPDETWTHQFQVIGMVVSGVFGITLVVFTITHVRLIMLNRTTIEDHDTPRTEGMLPCVRRGWKTSDGDVNQGNERLYDLGFKENWEQAMGKGWKCMIPVRFPRPEGPIYNQKVVARQWRDYNEMMERRRQEQQQPAYGVQPQQDTALVSARSTNTTAEDVHHRSNSMTQQTTFDQNNA